MKLLCWYNLTNQYVLLFQVNIKSSHTTYTRGGKANARGRHGLGRNAISQLWQSSSAYYAYYL